MPALTRTLPPNRARTCPGADRHAVMLAVALLLSASHVQVQAVVKIKSGDWQTDKSWDIGRVPYPTESALILNDTTVATSTKIANVGLENTLAILGDEGYLSATGTIRVGTTYDKWGGLRVDSAAYTALSVGGDVRIGQEGSGQFEVSRGLVHIGKDLRAGVGINPSAPGGENVSAFGEFELHGPETSVRARGLGLGSYAGNAARNGRGEGIIRDGAVLTTYGGEIAQGILTIDGSGSRWRQEVTDPNGYRDVLVQGRLDIRNGGEVSYDYTGGAFIIYGDRGVGSRGLVTVSGAGSRIDLSGRLELGRSSSIGGELDISDGASVRSGNSRITEQGLARIDGVGSRWQIDGLLDVLNAQSHSFLEVVNGGQVLAQSLKAGYRNIGVTTSANLSIIGAGSQLLVAQGLELGINGAGGGNAVMNIAAGGRVASASAGVGRQLGVGAQVQVWGNGSLWGVADSLDLGTFGNGQVQLAERGELTARSLALGGTAYDRDRHGAAGTLVFGGLTTAVAAGRLAVEQGVRVADSGRIVFNHSDGDFRFDTVLVSNLAGDGLIEQRAGTTRLVSDLSGFTGATRVAGGTLRVDGVLGSPLVTVESGATLGGSGVLLGDVLALDGAIVSPGNSPGILRVEGDFTLQAGAALVLELAGAIPGPGHDRLDVGGALSLAGGQLALRFIDGFAPRVDQQFVLFQVGGAFSDAASIEVFGLQPGWSYSTGFDAASGQLTLLSMNNGVSAVPEASPLWMLLAGLGVMGWRTRQRPDR